jgi:hypothetical protein
MSEKNLYYSLWRNHLNDIESKMSIATLAGHSLLLKKQEFETYGNRKASGYTFTLEIIHGRVVNNIKGSAVARDLYDILKGSEKAKSMFKEKNYKITLGKDYILKIRTIEPTKNLT